MRCRCGSLTAGFVACWKSDGNPGQFNGQRQISTQQVPQGSDPIAQNAVLSKVLSNNAHV